jgi:methionyl-tRNA formyltransferase
MKIVYYGYRDWSLDIFNEINVEKKYLVTHEDYDFIDSINPDLVLFVGWSKIIPESIINNHKCVCLHPSTLPKYRGGSPIQNQIIDGVIDSSVTLFLMDKGIDTGDILYQSILSLDGELDDIFDRIKKAGVDGINYIIENYSNFDKIRIKQDDSKSTFYKRRKSVDSEITLDEILNNEPYYLYNKIRSLTDPYPNAYIKCKDGKKLFITKSKYEK